jgi:hypothetical protein
MAWTEQCKIAFRTNATAKIGQQKHQNITKVLKELSKESSIPYETLRRWYYEKYKSGNRVKNDTTSMQKTDYSQIICINCGKKPVYLSSHGEVKKPYGRESKYYGLCSSCRKEKEAIIYLDREVDKNTGIGAVCPGCGIMHYINKNRIK